MSAMGLRTIEYIRLGWRDVFFAIGAGFDQVLGFVAGGKLGSGRIDSCAHDGNLRVLEGDSKGCASRAGRTPHPNLLPRGAKEKKSCGGKL